MWVICNKHPQNNRQSQILIWNSIFASFLESSVVIGLFRFSPSSSVLQFIIFWKSSIFQFIDIVIYQILLNFKKYSCTCLHCLSDHLFVISLAAGQINKPFAHFLDLREPVRGFFFFFIVIAVLFSFICFRFQFYSFLPSRLFWFILFFFSFSG